MANKGPYCQSYDFSSSHVWMWVLDHKEGWTTDAFEMWCRRSLLRVPLSATGSSQSNLKEINIKYALEELTLKLKLQYFGLMMHRVNSFEKTWCWKRVRAGGEEGGRGWNGWMASLTQWKWIWANSGRQWRTGKPTCFSPWVCRVRHNSATES